MTSYEIMKANIHFQNPDRIGLRFDRIAGKGDVCRIFVLPPKDKRDNSKTYSVSKKVRPGDNEYDEWGCLWRSDGKGSSMGEPCNIALEDLEEDLEDFQFPDPKAEGRFDGLEEALKEAEEKNLYVQLNSPQCIFERMHFLHGFEIPFAISLNFRRRQRSWQESLQTIRSALSKKHIVWERAGFTAMIPQTTGYPAGADDFSQEIP